MKGNHAFGVFSFRQGNRGRPRRHGRVYRVQLLTKRRFGAAAKSTRPAAVAASITGDDRGTAESRLLNAALHWGYGAAGGAARVLVERGGLTGWRREAAHLAAIWLPWRALLLATRRAKRDTWTALALDALKHTVYVLVTGRVYRMLSERRREG